MNTGIEIVVVSSTGSVTVKRTLYGEVTEERFNKEKSDAKRRAEMLDLTRPYPQIPIYPEDR